MSSVKRRSFLTYLGVGWAASCFPLVLSACNSSNSEKKSTVDTAKAMPQNSPAAGFKPIGKVTQLDKAGSLSLGKVLVVRDPANKAKLIAVNPTCTHQGCIVKWEAKEKTFECPCHDAHFSADGKVKSGPASKPLATYSAKISGDQVLVKMT